MKLELEFGTLGQLGVTVCLACYSKSKSLFSIFHTYTPRAIPLAMMNINQKYNCF